MERMDQLSHLKLKLGAAQYLVRLFHVCMYVSAKYSDITLELCIVFFFQKYYSLNVMKTIIAWFTDLCFPVVWFRSNWNFVQFEGEPSQRSARWQFVQCVQNRGRNRERTRGIYFIIISSWDAGNEISETRVSFFHEIP